jgi:hypothetical protein
MDDRFLGIYLNDHLAGATAGSAIARRSARSNRGTRYEDALAEIAKEIGEDHDILRQVMKRFGVQANPGKAIMVLMAERAGRFFKLNGRVLAYSPLSRLEELEALRVGVEGKLALWRTLKETRGADKRLEGIDLDELAKRAERQSVELESLRLKAAREALGTARARRAKP